MKSLAFLLAAALIAATLFRRNRLYWRARQAAFAFLTDGNMYSVGDISFGSGYPTRVLQRALEDMYMNGVVSITFVDDPSHEKAMYSLRRIGNA